MIFNQEQIQQILDIISFNHTLFISVNIGTDILTDQDKEELKLYGIDIDSIKTDFTPFEQQFYFGRLAVALGDKNANKLVYNDFLKYLRRGQYIPLNTREQETLKFLKQRTYSHIKNLGSRAQQTVSGLIIEEDQAQRDFYEETIKGSIERAVIERDTINSIVSEIGHKTNAWALDLGRIAATEMQNALEYGKVSEIEKRDGKDAEIWKEVYKNACRFCIKFYTTNGIGSEPKVFKISELAKNGTNVGKKQSDWLPTIYATHPWCRCSTHRKPKGYVWNEELKMFVAPKRDEEKPKKGITIKVGDKVFEI